ncbi:MAG TPA: isochorismatase family protein [Thermosulfurimonas dismutans]|uniref:Isochorismatase family protein n=1 Tax=Thermosulfurimonas dismutans TaxID=999894 RepID=A0A7C3CYY8_9BACT|nr:isochorismatase family protein [Thermosulfurimonas dismutans]
MRVRPEESLLLLIDPQEKLVRALWEADRLVRNLRLLIKASQILEVPILATSQYRKGLGEYVPEVLEVLGKEVEIKDKTEFSVFQNPEIASLIREKARRYLVLCGAETHICVYQSALSALEEGYRVIVVGDATSSRTPENFHYGLARLRDVGTAVVSTEMLVYEWLERAGTPAFKELMPWIKNATQP